MTTDAGNKQILRRRIAEQAAALPADYREEASRAIAEKLLQSEFWRQAKSVFLYFSLPTEPDTAPLFSAAFADNKTVYVPKCVSKTEMLAVRFTPETPLSPDAFGIPAPTAGAAVSPREIDLTVAPCVAADKTGVRLGHGAGYYDRFLANGGGRTVCLCFGRLLFERLPKEENDVRVDRVITEESRKKIK